MRPTIFPVNECVGRLGEPFCRDLYGARSTRTFRKAGIGPRESRPSRIPLGQLVK